MIPAINLENQHKTHQEDIRLNTEDLGEVVAVTITTTGDEVATCQADHHMDKLRSTKGPMEEVVAQHLNTHKPTTIPATAQTTNKDRCKVTQSGTPHLTTL